MTKPQTLAGSVDPVPNIPALARPYFCRGKATARSTAGPGQAGPYILRYWTWQRQRYWYWAQLRRSGAPCAVGQGGDYLTLLLQESVNPLKNFSSRGRPARVFRPLAHYPGQDPLLFTTLLRLTKVDIPRGESPRRGRWSP